MSHFYYSQNMASEVLILKWWVVIGAHVFPKNCPQLCGRPARAFHCWALYLSYPMLLLYDQLLYYYYFHLFICNYLSMHSLLVKFDYNVTVQTVALHVLQTEYRSEVNAYFCRNFSKEEWVIYHFCFLVDFFQRIEGLNI